VGSTRAGPTADYVCPAGRAIRHKNDWSMLVLVDTRYQSEKIHGKLPGWIEKSLVITQSFGQAIKTASQFFASKRES
jgi:chromosome transmission fidelity protein 1